MYGLGACAVLQCCRSLKGASSGGTACLVCKSHPAPVSLLQRVLRRSSRESVGTGGTRPIPADRRAVLGSKSGGCATGRQRSTDRCRRPLVTPEDDGTVGASGVSLTEDDRHESCPERDAKRVVLSARSGLGCPEEMMAEGMVERRGVPSRKSSVDTSALAQPCEVSREDRSLTGGARRGAPVLRSVEGRALHETANSGILLKALAVGPRSSGGRAQSW